MIHYTFFGGLFHAKSRYRFEELEAGRFVQLLSASGIRAPAWFGYITAESGLPALLALIEIGTMITFIMQAVLFFPPFSLNLQYDGPLVSFFSYATHQTAIYLDLIV